MIKKFHTEFNSIANAFQMFLRRLFVKKSQQFLQWLLGVSFFFFQGSLKEKQSPESLIVQENRWIFLCDICRPERFEVRKIRGHWTKYFNWNQRNSLRWFWFAVFKPVKRDTRCVLKFPLWRWRCCTCTFFSWSFLFRTIVFAFFLFYHHWKILLYPLWNFEKNKRICIWNSLTHIYFICIY